jgi:cyclopropane-fatty-acyl-phospholipid synthase
MNLETQIGIPLMERGWLPEWSVRLGIRRLIRWQIRRRHSEADATGGVEAVTERFVEELKRRPVAPVPAHANEQHYELPASFFLQVLGENLKYSCCLWEDGEKSLDSAERKMLDITLSRADINDGMEVLELGCGWGSATIALAEKFRKSRITAVSNSRLQKETILKRARDRALDNVRVITADMNDFDTADRFDRIVSIEMFEHMNNYEELFSRLYRWLSGGGKLFVHVFCHKNHPYFFETEGSHNWMGRYFFTGGIMPSDDLLPRFRGKLNLERHWRINGTHYRKTADAWAVNMDRRRKEIQKILREHYGAPDSRRWFMRWKVFFWACAETFGYDNGNEWGVSHYLFSKEQQ